MEEGIRGEPLQELIEGSFEKPIELQEDFFDWFSLSFLNFFLIYDNNK